MLKELGATSISEYIQNQKEKNLAARDRYKLEEVSKLSKADYSTVQSKIQT